MQLRTSRDCRLGVPFSCSQNGCSHAGRDTRERRVVCRRRTATRPGEGAGSGHLRLPLSNTLPIRRLALDAGDGTEIITAYIRVPELTVTVDPQRYTRLSADEYLHEFLDSDFRRTITVDDAGLMVTPRRGLWNPPDGPAVSSLRPARVVEVQIDELQGLQQFPPTSRR